MTAIAEKIRKLIAKANSSTHPEEGDTFMAKAQELMMAHGLSLLDLGRLDSEDPVGVDEEAATFSAGYSGMRIVAGQLARLYGCKMVFFKMPKNKVRIAVVGRESARITFTLMFPFVQRQLMKAGAELFNTGRYSSRIQSLNYVSNALAIRIAQLCDDQKQAEAKGARGINALVPVDLIDAAMNDAFPRLRESRSRSIKLDHAAAKKAEGISLHRQAGAAPSIRQIGCA